MGIPHVFTSKPRKLEKDHISPHIQAPWPWRNAKNIP
jgi:hypothetical protein